MKTSQEQLRAGIEQPLGRIHSKHCDQMERGFISRKVGVSIAPAFIGLIGGFMLALASAWIMHPLMENFPNEMPRLIFLAVPITLFVGAFVGSILWDSNRGAGIRKAAKDEAYHIRAEYVRKHLTRESYYMLAGRATLQLDSKTKLRDGDQLQLYYDDEYRMWARAVDEFEDGRFG